MSSINTALSGLKTADYLIDITSNNIANANNPNYSRQTGNVTGIVDSSTQIGLGAQVTSVTRVSSEFAVQQLRDNVAGFYQDDAYYEMASQFDSFLFSDGAGLESNLTAFFDALNDAASDPASDVARQGVLASANSLAASIQGVEDEISRLQQLVNSNLGDMSSRLTNLASDLAELNAEILSAPKDLNGNPASPLLDKRDGILEEMSEYVDITVTERAGGTANVSIGSGSELVTGGVYATVATQTNDVDATHMDVTVNGNVVTNTLSGGQFTGMLNIQDEMIKPSLHQINLLALGLADSMNTQHKFGMDIHNDLGGDFFTNIENATLKSGRVVADTNNLGTANLDVSISSVNDLQESTYTLSITSGSYSLVRDTDSSTVSSGATSGLPITVDGFTLTLSSGSFSTNDLYTLEPLYGAARTIGVEVTSSAKLALAYPVQTTTGAQNEGSGILSVASITNTEPTGAQLSTSTNTLTTRQASPVITPSDLTPLSSGDLVINGVTVGVTSSDGTGISPDNASALAIRNAIVAASVTGVAAGDVTAQTQFNLGAYTPGGGVLSSGDLVINGTSITGTFADASALATAITGAGITDISASVVNSEVIVSTSSGTTGGRNITVATNGGLTTTTLSNLPLTGVAQERTQQGAVTITANTSPSTLTVTGNDPGAAGFVAGRAIGTAGNAFNTSTYPDQLDPPVKIEFVSETQFRVYMLSGAEVQIGNTLTYDPSSPEIFPLTVASHGVDFDPGYRLSMSGAPKKGDSFTVGYNVGGVGDSSNIIDMAAVQSTELFGDNSRTVTQQYFSITNTVAIETSSASLSRSTSEVLMDQAINTESNISGVNLDEEAANLILYEQAYSAAAQVINVANTMFQTLMDAMR